jgi:hypothetical protein
MLAVLHPVTAHSVARRHLIPHAIGVHWPTECAKLSSMKDWLWTALFLGVVLGMWLLSTRMEPHYSSKDGRRFMANAQEIVDGKPVGRQRETRVQVMPDGLLHCARKRLVRRDTAEYVLVGSSPNPPKRRRVYLAHAMNDGMTSSASELAIRVPANSRVVPVLDEVLAQRALRKSMPGTN